MNLRHPGVDIQQDHGHVARICSAWVIALVTCNFDSTTVRLLIEGH